jgi:hypothetical protein
MKTKSIFIISCLFLLVMSVSQILAQQNTLPENYIRAKINVPLIINETTAEHWIKGRNEDTQARRDAVQGEISVWMIDVEITPVGNGFTGEYENILFPGSKEEISFAGTFSADRRTLLSLRIDYRLNTESSYQDEHTSSRFYLNDLKVHFADKPDNNGKFMYFCNYVKNVSSVYVEAYESTKVTKSSYSTTTVNKSLVWMDEDKIGWLPFGPNVRILAGPGEINHAIAVKGNSKTYAGFVMAALAKTGDLKLYDQTNRANTARAFEVSLNGLCIPEHIPLAKLTDDNLKNPPRCETTVTISEKDDAGKQILETTILIIGPKGKKELKYSLFYGETKERRSYENVYIEPTYIEFNRKLLANVDEIVATVLQLK